MVSDVPGQSGTKIFPCPVVPLSRDKGRSKNPGTNSKKDQISCFRTSFPVLERLFPGFLGVILSRDVPGQKSLSRDICSCPCPGTKGHRDKNFFLSRDKGTTGRPVPVCPAGRPVPWKP